MEKKKTKKHPKMRKGRACYETQRSQHACDFQAGEQGCCCTRCKGRDSAPHTLRSSCVSSERPAAEMTVRDLEDSPRTKYFQIERDNGLLWDC